MEKYIEIMKMLNEIEYGFKDKYGNNIINDNKKWEKEFYIFYYLLIPTQLLEKKCGICWDQVELERYLFKQKNLKCTTYFIFMNDENKMPSHTFLTFKLDNRYYWFEHAWQDYSGIHVYDDLETLLIDVKEKFIRSQNTNNDIYIYEYSKPRYNISCEEMYKYIKTQKLVKKYMI